MLYGTMLGAAILLTWRSSDHTLLKLGLLMLTSWLCSLAAFFFAGRETAPLLIPLLDAIICIGAAELLLRHQTRVALGVVLLFIVEEVFHGTSWMNGTQGSTDYYATLNVIFALQVLMVGGGSLVAICARWAPGLRYRSDNHAGSS